MVLWLITAPLVAISVINIITWRKRIAARKDIAHQKYLLENAWRINMRMEVVSICTVNLPELDFFKLMMGNNQGEGDERSVATGAESE